MVVKNLGYLNLSEVLKLEHFSIYKTHKNTNILIKNTSQDDVELYHPKKDRLPWKIVEAKKICSGVKIFDSKTNHPKDIDTSNWNNGNQIIAYEYFMY